MNQSASPRPLAAAILSAAARFDIPADPEDPDSGPTVGTAIWLCFKAGKLPMKSGPHRNHRLRGLAPRPPVPIGYDDAMKTVAAALGVTRREAERMRFADVPVALRTSPKGART